MMGSISGPCSHTIPNKIFRCLVVGETRHVATIILAVVLFFSVASSGAVQPNSNRIPSAAKGAAQAGCSRLPLKCVVLYKSGVGYFEHADQVPGTEEIHIEFTTGQLNNALKSLTAVDLSGDRDRGDSRRILEQKDSISQIPAPSSSRRPIPFADQNRLRENMKH